MGLLDELKKEAEQKEELARQEDAELQAREAYYCQELRPALHRAHDYFEELVQHLNAVERDIRPDYPLAPAGQPPIELRQGNYLCRADSHDSPRSVLVKTECVLDKKREIRVNGQAEFARYSALLEDHMLPHYTKKQLDESHEVAAGTFILEGPLTVQIRLQANPEERCVNLDLLNVESHPLKRYKFAPERIDEELLDRLARMLVREESTLVEVKVSEEMRAELRRKLEEENRRRAQAEAEAMLYREAERRAEEEARLLNRARRSMSGGIKKIFSRD